ncbi:uncharacterized protein GGS22DRAFT_49813 [Annulohypoxylon maeteangense]|uniref:uncharacterized protein n=1 Tax=Annulohypoxylon maeteangense TaxID=1927788 RepID=UPI002007F2DD|nr:uncharacterized protein GGS22DRAFT_49813 [Annulohypoxylon maeteangense]KAI0882279.1 hypothetical protein GGS22DRAFT_49813 [Annulohypoxylon maeteangense]
MNNYPTSPLSSPSYGHNIDSGASLCNIKTFGFICDFLDSLRAHADVSDDTDAATSDLHFLHSSSIPTFQSDRPAGNNQEPPVNASLVDGSSNSRSKGRQSQWQSSWRFIKKIDDYHQRLQECLKNIPGELSSWLKTCGESKDIRNCGLRALGDILQNAIPSEFPEIICAMIVQHAISHYASERSSFEDVQSAFTSWRNTVPLNKTNQESLDIVFEQLKLADKSSLEDARPTRPPFETQVFETGRQFTNPSPNFYPQTINDNSLSMWQFPNTNFTPRMNGDYLTPYPLNQPQPPNSFDLLGNQYSMPFVAPANRNQPFLSHEVDAHSTFQRQPHLHDPGPSYEYPEPFGCRPHGAQLDPGALNQSTSFMIFKRFIDNFTDQGDLPHLFAQTPIRWNNFPLTSNAQIFEKVFFNKIDKTFLSPLKDSITQYSQHPIAQAIVSATWSVTLLGALHSIDDAVRYMIHLSKSLFPDTHSCRHFAEIVLKACPLPYVVDVSSSSTGRPRHKTTHNYDQELDKIERGFNGEYHPAYLFASRASHSRDPRNQPTIPSQGSTSQPTLSIESAGSYTHSVYGTNTEISTPYELNNNQASSPLITVRCNQCDKVFKGKNISSHLSRHKRSHVDATIKCPNGDCTKTFKGGRTDNIRAHCRNVHNLSLPEDGRAFWAMLYGSPE